MFSINIKTLYDLPPEQLKREVKKLAAHIDAGKKLHHQDAKINECSLLAFDEPMQDSPSLNLIDDLNAVILRSIEKGIDKSQQKQLDTIRMLRDQIIAKHPIKDERANSLIKDALGETLSHLSPAAAGRVATVAQSWNKMTPYAQIKAINEGKLPIRTALIGMNAKQAIEWLAKNPACKFLEIADFTHVLGFDNECLQKLTDNCPNLKHLFIPDTSIHGDALKHLDKTPKLQSLSIAVCKQLEADALKHLDKTPKLQSLNIAACKQLDADALKHLDKTPKLQSLNIEGCDQLEADALKHLKNTPKLQSLNIVLCQRLEANALKHLEKTPKLHSLNIAMCRRLEADALKHLKNTPKLQSLNIMACNQLEADALKHLENTPGLQSLNIAACFKLKADALKHLEKTPGLQSLHSTMCDQLEFDKIPARLSFLLKL